MPNLKQEFSDAVKAAIGDNRSHGWGVDDSCEVIETLVAAEMPEGATPSDELMELIRLVVNPSAFRQTLEKTKRADGKTILAATERKRGGKTPLPIQF